MTLTGLNHMGKVKWGTHGTQSPGWRLWSTTVPAPQTRDCLSALPSLGCESDGQTEWVTSNWQTACFYYQYIWNILIKHCSQSEAVTRTMSAHFGRMWLWHVPFRCVVLNRKGGGFNTNYDNQCVNGSHDIFMLELLKIVHQEFNMWLTLQHHVQVLKLNPDDEHAKHQLTIYWLVIIITRQQQHKPIDVLPFSHIFQHWTTTQSSLFAVNAVWPWVENPRQLLYIKLTYVSFVEDIESFWL